MSYFVTTKCSQGRTVFQIPEIAALMVDILIRYRDRGNYLLHEFVVMPDHLHLILTPSPQTSLEKSMQMIKGGGSFEIHKRREQKMEIWQPGFHDWTIRDAGDWDVKADYIRMNPVRAKLVAKIEDWPNSSASGRFHLDSMPAKYSQLSSGAKALVVPPATPELKLRPPEENKARA